MVRQKQVFENKTERVMFVYVEMNPDRYTLRPGDKMVIEFDHTGRADDYGLHTILHADGDLQIYLEKFDTTVVTINGRKVEPWEAVN